MAEFTDARLKEMGQLIAGRIAEGWPRWAETLRAYEDGMQRIQHNQRGAKQFGTLLAAADLLMHDTVPEAGVVDDLVKGLERNELYEYENSDPTWLKTHRHILSAQPDPWKHKGGGSVAEVIRDFMNAVSEDDRKKEQRKLNLAGLAITRDRKRGHFWLAVPSTHQQLSAMFRHTDLQANGGDGLWTTSLRGAPKYDPERDVGGAFHDPKVCPGIYRVENVPQLDGAKCTHIRLSATVMLAGVETPIFVRDPDSVITPEGKAA